MNRPVDAIAYAWSAINSRHELPARLRRGDSSPSERDDDAPAAMPDWRTASRMSMLEEERPRGRPAPRVQPWTRKAA